MTTTPTAPSTVADLTGTWTLDPTHTRIGFVARHAMVTKVRGSFNELDGHGFFDASNPPASSLSLTIQAASIDTRNADRDGHLRSNDFFDMANHPEVIFASTAVEKVADTTYRVTGELTIKGTTRPVTVDVEYTGAAESLGFAVAADHARGAPE